MKAHRIRTEPYEVRLLVDKRSIPPHLLVSKGSYPQLLGFFSGV